MSSPDLLAFAANGDLYVTLALSNQLSALDEIARIGSAPGDPIPLDAPAAIAFDARTRTLLIANHALLTGDPTHFAVLATFVSDPGDPLEEPFLP